MGNRALSASDEHVNGEFAVHQRIKRGDQPINLLLRTSLSAGSSCSSTTSLAIRAPISVEWLGRQAPVSRTAINAS